MTSDSNWIVIVGISFCVSIFFKIDWLILGVVMFIGYLNNSACKGLSVDYLIFYFTWFSYIFMFSLYRGLLIATNIDKFINALS
jgi:hypothetical protein